MRDDCRCTSDRLRELETEAGRSCAYCQGGTEGKANVLTDEAHRRVCWASDLARESLGGICERNFMMLLEALEPYPCRCISDSPVDDDEFVCRRCTALETIRAETTKALTENKAFRERR